MNTIDEFIKKLAGNPEIKKINSRKLLHNTADMFERYGYYATRVFLRTRRGEEPKILITILDQMESENIPRDVKIMIIKNLTIFKGRRR
ncbi:MAG: hypothetical protein ACFFD4_34035 [Candidatus Odinarchaeota archaeon]